jgi:hypothetical protein
MPLDLGLLGILLRASMDFGSATYPGYHELLELLWLFLVLRFLLALPDAWSLPDEASLWRSCLLSILVLTYCQLPRMVCQNFWLSVAKDQLSDEDSMSENFLWHP